MTYKNELVHNKKSTSFENMFGEIKSLSLVKIVHPWYMQIGQINVPSIFTSYMSYGHICMICVTPIWQDVQKYSYPNEKSEIPTPSYYKIQIPVFSDNLYTD